MAIVNDYQTGTVSVANGSTAVTGVGTAWQVDANNPVIRPGDLFGRAGLWVPIASVTDNTHLTLAENWPGTTLSGSAYRIRIQPDGSRYTAAARALVEMLADGKLASLAAQTGAADKLPYLTGATTFGLADLTEAARSVLARTDIKSDAYAPLHIGDRDVSNSVDAQVLLARNVNDAVAGNGHGFSDSSLITRSGTVGYASYDATVNFDGAANFDHYAAFQSALKKAGAGTMTNNYGLFHKPTVTGGKILYDVGVKVEDAALSGGGSIDYQFAFYVAPLNAATVQAWGYYSEGNNRNFFGIMPEVGVEGRKIIERGTNANGSYVRFGDGTMICLCKTTGYANTADGALYRDPTARSVTFPAAFMETPNVAASSYRPTSFVAITSLNTVSCSATIVCTFSSGTVTDIYVTAIGRWF